MNIESKGSFENPDPKGRTCCFTAFGFQSCTFNPNSYIFSIRQGRHYEQQRPIETELHGPYDHRHFCRLSARLWHAASAGSASFPRHEERSRAGAMPERSTTRSRANPRSAGSPRSSRAGGSRRSRNGPFGSSETGQKRGCLFLQLHPSRVRIPVDRRGEAF